MRRGFTTLEITIAVLILAGIVALLVNVYSGSLDSQRMNEATEGIIALAQKARSATIASLDNSGGQGVRYGLHFDPYNTTDGDQTNQVVMFRGDTYSGGAIIETYRLPVGIRVSTVLTGGTGVDVNNIFFKRIIAEVEVKQGVTFVPPCSVLCVIVTITSERSGASRNITISRSGIIAAQ